MATASGTHLCELRLPQLELGLGLLDIHAVANTLLDLLLFRGRAGIQFLQRSGNGIVIRSRCLQGVKELGLGITQTGSS